ncbi:MAG: hypothetical protein M0P69_12345 [Bacteroidales bacterium]|jgi:hypothetical protein|nr:hypothetical protein [Bacteroidales bacterium]
MANLKTKAIDSTDMAEIREGAYRHKRGTFKLIGEMPQKTGCSYEPENGLNERGVENDICGLELAIFLIILIVTLSIAALCLLRDVKAIKEQIKIDHETEL